MTQERKHIAILLYWIFIFPIVFQSFHIVVHHSHTDLHNHELCNHHLPKQSISYDYVIESQHDQSCPICDYQFSINDLPNILFLASVVPLKKGILNELEVHFPFQTLFSHKSPRAPPVID